MNDKKNNKKILEILGKDYAEYACGLDFVDPYQLLIATILSAQCTDVRVNQITPALFEKYPTVEDMAAADQDDVIQLIHSCGFYKNKSKNILGASQKLVADFDGVVPNDMEELMSLPGVGRKTANVVAANAFHQDAIAVDTHVFRVSNRLGLANARNEYDTEMQLRENIPQDLWSQAHHWLIWHGRKICHSRKPACDICNLRNYCHAYKTGNFNVREK